jgi:hypothetical protein
MYYYVASLAYLIVVTLVHLAQSSGLAFLVLSLGLVLSLLWNVLSWRS